MISSQCSIEAFVEAVKDKDAQTVIAMAIEEATQADRLALKNHQRTEKAAFQRYAGRLKQLIDYHRYAVKPRKARETTYHLYMKYWGTADTFADALFEPATVLVNDH